MSIALEDLYHEVIINEKLAKFNINNQMIRAELEEQYAKYRALTKTLNPTKTIKFDPMKNDDEVIKNILIAVYREDERLTIIFDKFIETNDRSQLKRDIVQNMKTWEIIIQNRELSWSYKNQPLNMAVFSILKKNGLDIFPTGTNAEGWPVYPKHLLPNFIGMNIVAQYIKDGRMDKDQKAEIDKHLVTMNIKDLYKKEIAQYMKPTMLVGNESEGSKGQDSVGTDIENNPTEVQVPQVPNRIDLIRKLMAKKQ